MAEDNDQLFAVLKTALWSGESRETPIPAAIREELRAQTVEGLTALAFPDSANRKYHLAAQFTWMARAQDEAIRLLQAEDIPVAVIKGTAAGIYYPKPYLRTYGDVDLLVQPAHYHRAVERMRAAGWQQEGEIGPSHTALHKGGFLFELHQSPPGLDRVKEGAYIRTFLRAGFADLQQGRIAQPACCFPMLPWQQNGLELIWHFREHLYNGIGLRHAIDWMMFVDAKLRSEQAFEEFRPVLEKAGLLTLAKSVARMCQLYLGLSAEITWCMDCDDAVCAALMDFILEQGNFGHKKSGDKAAKVMSRYRTPLAFLRAMQQKGVNEWAPVRQHPALRPFAWLYTAGEGIRYIRRHGLHGLQAERSESERRQALFDALYGDQADA